MEFEQLIQRVLQAINALYERDSALLTQDASEWALAHRLAVYLEQLIPGWNVDCEYNRQGPAQDAKVDEHDQRIRPDIVLHCRGRIELQHNLLVVELKKRQDTADFAKARQYTELPNAARPFQYQYGLALSLLDNLELHWYENGRERN